MKRESGITLVSLVITIIVLIIIAGITINMTVGENGILNKAKDTKKNTENFMEGEEQNINELYDFMGGNTVNGGLAYDKIRELKEELQAHKKAIATAITEKGVPTQETDTTKTMADNIRKIKTGSSSGGSSGGGTGTNPAMLFCNYNRQESYSGTKTTATLTYESTYTGPAYVYAYYYGRTTYNHTESSNGGKNTYTLTLNGENITSGSLVELKEEDVITSTMTRVGSEEGKSYYECYTFLAICGVE